MSRTPEREEGHALSRAEVLGGLAGRRASSAQFVIESRATFLALKARTVTAPVLCEGAIEEEERAYLTALAAGRDLAPPTIQQLEQFAPQWAYLVPQDAVARAELAHRFGDKYRFRASDVHRMRAALGLDEPAVQQAYRDRHRGELPDVYDADLTVVEKLRWTRSRISRRFEELPPFWTSFGLTLTETVGTGLLALPIALAGLGPLPGVVLIVVLGLLNVLTVAAVAESFTRTGAVRWRGAYFGRVVRGYLGVTGSTVFSLGMTVLDLPVLLACYIGFAVTVGATTGTSALLWVAVIFVVDIALVLRNRLDATIASALIVGGLNVLALLTLVVLALTVLDVDKVRYVALPFGGGPFGPSVLELAFGVVLLCFYGHTSVGNCAKVVLKRDPGGRSLIKGCVAAMATVVVLYGLWVFAVGSAVPVDRLRSEAGTALIPLAEVAGRAATIAGFVFVFLSIPLGTVHTSLGLYNLVRERLVGRPRVARWFGLGLLGAIFLAAEILLLTGKASFAVALGIIGALIGPLLAGVFPMLLLQSSRRRGDYVPALSWRWIGRPPVPWLVFAVFMSTEAVYVWLWPTPLQRWTAAAVVVTVLVATALMLRSGALRPRAVVELRRDESSGHDTVHVVSTGHLIRQGTLPPGEREVDVELGPLRVHEVRAWAHQVDAGGESEPLALTAALRRGDESVAQEVRAGAVEVATDGSETLELTLPRLSRAGPLGPVGRLGRPGPLDPS